MDAFKCPKCAQTFSYNKNLKYHIDNDACKDRGHVCKYCQKKFTTATSMYRHMRNSCLVKKEEESRRDEIYEALLDRMVNLEKSNAALKKDNVQLRKELKNNTSKVDRVLKRDKDSTVGVNNGVVNINNGTVNHITLIAHGKEDISKIDKRELIRVFGSGFNSTLKLTETMHFNPKYPEFHNVYISSMKNKYAMVYDGNDWTLVMKDDLIDKLYDNKRDYIEENLDDFLDSLTNSQIKALHRWMDADESHPYIAKIKNDIKLLLYNKRNMALNAKYREIDELDNSPQLSNPILTMIETIESTPKVAKVAKATKIPKTTPVPKRKKRVASRTGKHRKHSERRKI